MSNLLFLISAMGNCPAPVMVDWTSTPWVERDSRAYHTAMEGCKRRYGADSPCLKKFIKKEEGTYYAICGRPVNEVHNSNGTSSNWFFIGSNQVPGKPGGTSASGSAEEQGCGGTCPNRPAASGGRK